MCYVTFQFKNVAACGVIPDLVRSLLDDFGIIRQRLIIILQLHFHIGTALAKVHIVGIDLERFIKIGQRLVEFLLTNIGDCALLQRRRQIRPDLLV